MSIKTKIAIFLIAVLLSLFEFNLITCSSCFVDMLKMGKKAGYKIIANVIAEEAKTSVNPSG